MKINDLVIINMKKVPSSWKPLWLNENIITKIVELDNEEKLTKVIIFNKSRDKEMTWWFPNVCVQKARIKLK